MLKISLGAHAHAAFLVLLQKFHEWSSPIDFEIGNEYSAETVRFKQNSPKS